MGPLCKRPDPANTGMVQVGPPGGSLDFKEGMDSHGGAYPMGQSMGEGDWAHECHIYASEGDGLGIRKG